MKHHRILSTIIFIFLAIILYKLGQTFVENRKIENIKQEVAKAGPLVVDPDLIKTIEIKSNSKYGTVSGSYPQFSHVNPSFNDRIRNAIFIAQSEFENNVKLNWEAMKDTSNPDEKVSMYPPEGDFTFIIKTDYMQVNQDTVSVLITVAGYSGGAHGYESMISFNYNVKEQKEITLADLFPNDPNYLKTIADFSRKDLNEQFTNKIKRADFDNDGDYKMTLDSLKDMIDPGTEPTVENFSVFTISPGVLNIHFSQYQVAAYVYGSQMVKMPLESTVLTN